MIHCGSHVEGRCEFWWTCPLNTGVKGCKGERNWDDWDAGLQYIFSLAGECFAIFPPCLSGVNCKQNEELSKILTTSNPDCVKNMRCGSRREIKAMAVSAMAHDAGVRDYCARYALDNERICDASCCRKSNSNSDSNSCCLALLALAWVWHPPLRF